jgi:hypothetical protein
VSHFITSRATTASSSSLRVSSRGGKAATLDIELDKGFERRFVFCPPGGELLRDARRSGAAYRQQQPSLGAKALDERGGNDPGFFGHTGERELSGVVPLHGAGGGGQDFGIRSFARTGRHSFKALQLGAKVSPATSHSQDN